MRPDNVYRREGARLLELAEAESTRLGHGHVGTWHFWIALLRDDAPALPREVLRSMGVDSSSVPEIVAAWGDMTVGSGASMNPRAQHTLGRARRGRRVVTAADVLDVLLRTMIRNDARLAGVGVVEGWLAAHGFDPEEARTRLAGGLAAVRSSPVMPLGEGPLPRARPPALVELMTSPAGHDPWDRRPWFSRHLMLPGDRVWMVDDRHVFVFTDADGWTVRAPDGRPVGYRFEPGRTGQPAIEILHPPPVEAGDWLRVSRDG